MYNACIKCILPELAFHSLLDVPSDDVADVEDEMKSSFADHGCSSYAASCEVEKNRQHSSDLDPVRVIYSDVLQLEMAGAILEFGFKYITMIHH